MMGNMFYGFDGISNHMFWGGGIFMMIGGLLIFGLFIYWVVALSRHIQPVQPITNNDLHQDTGTALKILNERYARDEVNEEEYARKKSELRK